MKYQIIAPSIGDHTKSCVLTRWHKDDSCIVVRGELVATLETKKATLDIEAEHDGCLHHALHEGMTVVFGQSIGYIEYDGPAPRMIRAELGLSAPGEGDDQL